MCYGHVCLRRGTTVCNKHVTLPTLATRSVAVALLLFLHRLTLFLVFVHAGLGPYSAALHGLYALTSLRARSAFSLTSTRFTVSTFSNTALRFATRFSSSCISFFSAHSFAFCMSARTRRGRPPSGGKGASAFAKRFIEGETVRTRCGSAPHPRTAACGGGEFSSADSRTSHPRDLWSNNTGA